MAAGGIASGYRSTGGAQPEQILHSIRTRSTRRDTATLSYGQPSAARYEAPAARLAARRLPVFWKHVWRKVFFFAKKNRQFWKIEKQKSKKYANTRYFKSRTLFAEEIINLRNGLGFVVRSVC